MKNFYHNTYLNISLTMGSLLVIYLIATGEINLFLFLCFEKTKAKIDRHGKKENDMCVFKYFAKYNV